MLINLNQQRERFRDSFANCLAFLLPQYAIKYIIHCAPDFFDWRPSLVNSASDLQTPAEESARVLAEASHSACKTWTGKELIAKSFELQSLADKSGSSGFRVISSANI